ncbi:MAG: colicin import membrane protein [Gallionellaceae bacterium]|nr:MAG: colicin import membrane protein [Gallionellaceae bacterium]
MSHALTYQEPYRVPAGLLALVVHAAFIGLLVIGVRWQSQPPEDFSVELWDSLPVVEPLPEPIPPPAAEPIPPVEAKVEAPQAKPADIELREKKISKVEPSKPTAKELKERKQAEEQRLLGEYAEKRRLAMKETMRAEIAAATSAEVGRFQDMIRSKIRRNIVGIPPDLPADAKAEFKVTMLPGGMVLDVQLVKTSGNRAYDDAAERAIYKAQPLPLPTDVGLQKMFRELRLTIKPQE